MLARPLPRTHSRQSKRGARLLAAVSAAVAGSALSVVAVSLAGHDQPVRTVTPLADTSPMSVSGRGATVPFTEYEAEDATTNGTVIGPDRTFGTLASEASGRKAVTLSGQGKYVEFTLTQPANSIDVHYSIPDSADGSGSTDPLALYVGGTKNQDLSLTSHYSWYYGSYPFTNNPGDGKGHHFYDDVRAMFSSTLQTGTKVRLQVDSGDNAPSYTIDYADFENVAAPATQPSGSISVTQAPYNADPTGKNDSTTAIQNAINAAESAGTGVWLPQGTYQVNAHLIVNNVSVTGAGPWYSTLTGNGVGVYGNSSPGSTNVHLSNFAIVGQVAERVDADQVNGIGGAIGGGSTISNLWIQHTKCGMWFDGPFDGLTITGVRIQDTTADGINLHDGISHVTVTNSVVRNTGDDGLAMWSDQNADHDNAFTFDTVEMPNLANNIAIYGGHDNSATDDVVSDTLWQGGGLHVANRFNSVPLSGMTTIARDTTIRAGVLDQNWQFGVGALWFDALNAPINGTINVSDVKLIDSSYEGIQWIEGGPITGVTFNNVDIDGAGTFALQLQTTGSASFSNVTAEYIGYSNPIYSCEGTNFTINQGSGNSGWYTATPYCGNWPPPVYTYPGNGTTSPPPTTTPPTTTTPPAGTDLALNRPATASGSTQNYSPANAVDGNPNSYWESTDNSFPQWLTVDLGAPTSIGRIVLDLPPLSSWPARTQTLSVQGSGDGNTFSTIVGSAGYSFDPAGGNTATITFPATTTRYVRLTFTANTGWPAGQVSELRVYSS